MSESRYKAAGVDIDAATYALDKLKPSIRATYSDAVLADVGSFGGLYSLANQPHDSVLVSSIDGVGTKVMLAAELNQWNGIGHDIVNHCVNDILVQNARPLFFMDYVAASKINPEQVASVVMGMAEACRRVGCALIAGETAEMPGVYSEGAFDVVGAIVGIAQRDHLLPRKDHMQVGNVLLGLPSSGPHTNGYTLIRQAVAGRKTSMILDDHRTLGDALLAPHRAYLQEINSLADADVPLLGMAHITGGGLLDNVPRILPDHLAAEIDLTSWEIPELFKLLVEWSEMTGTEPFRVFNMGIGMALVVPQASVSEALHILPEAVPIGALVHHREGDAGVRLAS